MRPSRCLGVAPVGLHGLLGLSARDGAGGVPDRGPATRLGGSGRGRSHVHRRRTSGGRGATPARRGPGARHRRGWARGAGRRHRIASDRSGTAEPGRCARGPRWAPGAVPHDADAAQRGQGGDGDHRLEISEDAQRLVTTLSGHGRGTGRVPAATIRLGGASTGCGTSLPAPEPARSTLSSTVIAAGAASHGVSACNAARRSSLADANAAQSGQSRSVTTRRPRRTRRQVAVRDAAADLAAWCLPSCCELREVAPCLVDALLGRSHRGVQSRRDLLVTETVELAHQQRSARPLGQLTKVGHEQREALPVDRVILGGRSAKGRRLGRLGATPATAQDRDRLVVNDPVEPGTYRSIAAALQGRSARRSTPPSAARPGHRDRRAGRSSGSSGRAPGSGAHRERRRPPRPPFGYQGGQGLIATLLKAGAGMLSGELGWRGSRRCHANGIPEGEAVTRSVRQSSGGPADAGPSLKHSAC